MHSDPLACCPVVLLRLFTAFHSLVRRLVVGALHNVGQRWRVGVGADVNLFEISRIIAEDESQLQAKFKGGVKSVRR